MEGLKGGSFVDMAFTSYSTACNHVFTSMPVSQVERTVMCPMTSLQVALYNHIRSQVMRSQSLCDTTASAPFTASVAHPTATKAVERAFRRAGRRLSLSQSNVLMQLRKTCNHPYLLLEGLGGRSIPDDIYEEHLVSTSGKMCMLERLLFYLLPQGHKVLIFSQMTTMLDVLAGLSLIHI